MSRQTIAIALCAFAGCYFGIAALGKVVQCDSRVSLPASITVTINGESRTSETTVIMCLMDKDTDRE